MRYVCLTENEVVRYCQHRLVKTHLVEAHIKGIEFHLSVCQRCQERVDAAYGPVNILAFILESSERDRAVKQAEKIIKKSQQGTRMKKNLPRRAAVAAS